MGDVTELLGRCANDAAARDQVYRIIYDHLCLVAKARVGEWRDPALRTAELVNEAYLKMVHGGDVAWKSRAHFYAAASLAMGRILKDLHRRRNARKRGGGAAALPLQDDDAGAAWVSDEMILAIDLFDELARDHPLTARVAQLHYCAGRDFAEVRDILAATESAAELTAEEVARHWALARAWIRARLTKGEP